MHHHEWSVVHCNLALHNSPNRWKCFIIIYKNVRGSIDTQQKSLSWRMVFWRCHDTLPLQGKIWAKSETHQPLADQRCLPSSCLNLTDSWETSSALYSTVSYKPNKQPAANGEHVNHKVIWTLSSQQGRAIMYSKRTANKTPKNTCSKTQGFPSRRWNHSLNKTSYAGFTTVEDMITGWMVGRIWKSENRKTTRCFSRLRRGVRLFWPKKKKKKNCYSPSIVLSKQSARSWWCGETRVLGPSQNGGV